MVVRMDESRRYRARDLVQPEHEPPWSTRAFLLVVMALGSLAMWTLNPAVWLVITARLQEGTSPRMGPYALMLVGITLTCVALGKGISLVHRRYERITGRTPTIRVIMPWRRSLRSGRSLLRETDGRLPVNALDVIMVVSALLALTTLVLWLIIVNPTPPNIGGPGPAKD
ncbi:MAG: hypothetical protein JWM31_2848 [Solirubrobacterales bacterium]|nr:hypothetical protein [Solirubrobacterales bacterium]